MITHKKGLSTVITTLIIILLVLVAVGIIWVVVRNTVEEGVSQIDFGSECLKVDVKATAVDCTLPAACDVTLKRSAGGDAIAGVKIVFTDATGLSGAVVTQEGNIEALATTPITVDSGLAAPTKVEITAYFEDTSGKEQVCSQSSEFNF